jgi:hypothetical protein
VTSPVGEGISLRRTWLAIAVATLIATISYWAVILSFSALEEAGAAVGGGAFALGLALVPFAFSALGFISGNRRAPMAVLSAMFLFLLVGTPVFIFSRVLGLVIGFGAGAVVTLRREQHHRLRTRSLAVALSAVLILLLALLFPPLAITIAPAAPFTAVGLANRYDDRKHAAG